MCLPQMEANLPSWMVMVYQQCQPSLISILRWTGWQGLLLVESCASGSSPVRPDLAKSVDVYMYMDGWLALMSYGSWMSCNGTDG